MRRACTKPSLREVLEISHVAAVCIGILLLWSIESALRALWDPLWRGLDFIINAVAILGIPYFSRRLTMHEWLEIVPTLADLISALVCLAGAWLLSKWVYKSGPTRSLCVVGSRLIGRNHV
jgi:hypothetical protein